MAKKDLKTSGVKLDDGLDIPDFNFDDEVTQVKDDRSPIVKVASSTIAGATNKIKDHEFLQKQIKGMLPDGYGQAIDIADQGLYQGRKLYDKAVKEIKPAIGDFAKAAKALVPGEESWLSKKLGNIKDWASEYENKAPSKDKIREDNIALGLADVFKAQMENQAKLASDQNVNGKIDQGVNLVRHKESMGVFASIDRNISALTQYQDKVTAVYQRKSLELQYRSYFAQLDSLEQMRKTYVDHTDALKVIAKNTALPEFTKITASERFKDITRNNFYQSITGNLFKNTNDLVAGFSKNLGDAVNDKISKIKDAFTMGASGLEAVSTANEMAESFSDENAPKESKKLKAAKFAGDIGGGMGVEYLAGKAGAWIKEKLEKNKTVGSIGKKLQRSIIDLPGAAEKFRTSSMGMSQEDTALSNLWNTMLEGVKSLIPSLQPETAIQTDKFENLTDPFIFTKQSHLSINEVIPGYLARIFREIQVFRTGNENIELTKYDFTSKRFSGMSKVAQSFLSKISGTDQSKEIERRVENLVKEIDANSSLTPEAKEALKKELTKRSFTGQASDIETVTDKNRFLTKEAQQFSTEIIKVFQEYFNLDENSKMKDDKDLSSLDNQLRFTTRLQDVKTPIKDSRGDIQNLQNLGQQDVLEKLGLINTKNNTINMDRFLELSTDFDKINSELGKSSNDNLNIPLTNRPASIVAQQQLQSLRDEVRVNNTETNPVPVKVMDSFKQQNTTVNDDNVKKEIQQIISLVSKGIENNQQYFDFNKQIIQSMLGEIVKINARMNEPYFVYNLNGGAGGGQGIDTSDYTKVDNSVTGNIKNMFSSGINLGSKAGKGLFSASSKLSKGLFNTFKSSFNPLKSAAKTASDLASTVTGGLFDKIIKFKDVYIPGELEPRITAAKLKAGKYFIKTKDGSMQVLQSVKDIKETVYDELGNVVIDRNEIKDIYTKAVVKGKSVISKIGGMLFAGQQGVQNAIGSGLSFAGNTMSSVMDTGKKVLTSLLNTLDRPQDVYIKGEQEPRLIGRLMTKGLYFSARTNKAIQRPSDIDGEILDENKQVLISMDDLKKGIVDVNGKEFKTPLLKLADIAFGSIKRTFSVVSNIGNNVFSKIMGGFGSLGKFFTDGVQFGMGSKKSIDILTEIRDLIKMRFTGNTSVAQDTENKTRDFIAPITSKKINEVEKPKTGEASKGLLGNLGSITDKIKGIIPGKKEPSEGQENKGIFSTLKNLFTPKNKPKDKILAAKDKTKANFKTSGENTERKGSWRDMATDRRKINDFTKAKADKTYTGLLGSLGGILGSVGTMFSGLLSGLTSVGGILGSVVTGLGSVGKLLVTGIGSLLSGNLMGKVGGLGGGAGKVGKLGGLGTIVKGAAGAVGTGAKAIGGAAIRNPGLVARGLSMLPMMASGLSLGGAGALAMGAGSMAVAAAPFVLTALAIGGIGYGAYKAYKYVSKNKAANDLENLRLAQYGFNPSDDEYTSRVLEFENLINDNTQIKQDGSVVLDGRKFDYTEVLKIFDINPEDQEHKDKWKYWFENRFRQVYTTHRAALFKVSKKETSLEDGLSDLDAKQSFEFLKAVELPSGPYEEIVSPFKDLQYLPSDSSVVRSLYASIKEKLEKLAQAKTITEKTKDALTPLANQIKDKSDKGLNLVRDKTTQTMDSVIGKEKREQLLDAVSSPEKMWDSFKKITTDLGTGIKDKISVTSNSIVKMAGFDITKLDSIRFRIYGLNELDRQKVVALRLIEDKLHSKMKVKYNSNGSVTFTGDTDFIIKETGAEFGITSATDRNAANYLYWFNKRFLPVYLEYLGAINTYTGKADLNPNSSVKKSVLFQIAQKLQGLASPWSVDTSPWFNYKLNTDKNSINDIVAAMQREVEDDKLKEEKILKAKTLLEQSNVNKVKEETKKPDSKTIKQDPSAIKNANMPASKVGVDHEEAPANDSDAQTVNKEQINISIPKIAKGAVLEGLRAKQFIKLAKASVDIDNLHPALAKRLFGMIEEYGTLTGNSVQINEGFRSYETQAALHKKMPDKAAPPGSSLHEKGLAVDMNTGDLDAMDKMGLMKKYGFTRPIGGETWHAEPSGLSMNINGAKSDPSLAAQLIESSVGRGGGGYGSIKGTPLGRRNIDIASRIYNTGGQIPQDPVGMAGNKDNQIKPAVMAKNEADKSVASSTQPQVQSAAKQSVNTQSVTPASNKNIVLASAKGYGGGGGKPVTMQASADIEDSKTADVKSSVVGSKNKASNIPNATGQGIEAVGPTIEAAAKTVGVNPDFMKTVAGIESGFNPNAKASTSSASGLFQFISSTWNEMLSKYGRKYDLEPNTSPFDAKANALMGGEYIKTNTSAIKSVKSDVNPVDVYMAHFLGSGGARTFFSKDRDTDAASAMPAAAKANRSIFYKPNGVSRTIGEVYDLMKSKVQNTSSRLGLNIDLGNAQIGNDNKSVPDKPPSTKSPTANPPVNKNIKTADYKYNDNTVKEKQTEQPQQGYSKAAAALSNKSNPQTQVGGFTSSVQSNQNAGSKAEVAFAGVDSTLKESLDVQTEILDVLKQMHVLSQTTAKQMSEINKLNAMKQEEQKREQPNARNPPALDAPIGSSKNFSREPTPLKQFPVDMRRTV